MTSLITENNSYITLADANTYFSTRLHSSKWDSATDTDKEKALITATKSIDCIRFKGFLCEQNQSLQFPRYVSANYLTKRTYTDKINLVNVNGKQVIFIDITRELKEAVCEEAISLLDFGSSAHIKNQELGIKNIDIGVGSTAYEATGKQLLSSKALQLIDKYIQKMGRVV